MPLTLGLKPGEAAVVEGAGRVRVLDIRHGYARVSFETHDELRIERLNLPENQRELDDDGNPL